MYIETRANVEILKVSIVGGKKSGIELTDLNSNTREGRCKYAALDIGDRKSTICMIKSS